jgi:hypothetical protein
MVLQEQVAGMGTGNLFADIVAFRNRKNSPVVINTYTNPLFSQLVQKPVRVRGLKLSPKSAEICESVIFINLLLRIGCHTLH